MAISILWDDENRSILRWNFIGEWTIQDFYDVYDELGITLAQSPHRMHVLLDMTGSSHVPNGFISALRGVRSRPVHENMGIMISIGNSMFIRSFVNTFTKIYPARKTQFYMAGSYQEACKIIAEQEP